MVLLHDNSAASASPSHAEQEQPRALPPSELADTLRRYSLDRAALQRRYAVDYSPAQRERVRTFVTEWRDRLDALSWDGLGVEGRLDGILLDNALRRDQARLDLEAGRWQEARRFVPFAVTIMGMMESRRRLETLVPSQASARLAAMAKEVDSLRKLVEPPAKPDTSRAVRIVALRSIRLLEAQQRTLEQWYRFYAGYDPLFTWWNADPYKRASEVDHLAEAGLVKRHRFREGHARFESAFDRAHHDHMVCERCGAVIEFVCEEIEALQERVCAEHGFRPLGHVHQIFGLCRSCQVERP